RTGATSRPYNQYAEPVQATPPNRRGTRIVSVAAYIRSNMAKNQARFPSRSHSVRRNPVLLRGCTAPQGGLAGFGGIDECRSATALRPRAAHTASVVCPCA